MILISRWVVCTVQAMFVVALCLPFILITLPWILIYLKNRKYYAAVRNLPTVLPTFPLIGHIHHLMFTNDEGYNKNLLFFITQPGHAASCVWLGPRPHLILHRADDVRRFLTSSKNVEKSEEYKLINFVLGNGLITAPADMWKKSRSHLKSVFHPRNLAILEPVLNRAARDLADQLGTLSLQAKGPIEVFHVILVYTLGNVLHLCFGNKQHKGDTMENRRFFIELMDRSTVAFRKRVYSPWMWPDCTFNLFERDLLKDVVKIYKAMVKPNLENELNRCKMQGSLEEPNKHNVVWTDGNDPHQLTVPQALYPLHTSDSRFNEEYMKEELTTLLSAGTDTLAVTMSSCLLALATHPHVQDKLYQEIIDTVGQHFDDITVDDINRMPYLDQVLKETMRRFIAIPFITRRADKDIQMDGFVIPTDMTVGLALRSLHLDGGTFADPESFDPEHFSADREAVRPTYSFMPFAGGSRDCIGKYFAKVEMKIMIVHIIKEYRVYSDMDIQNLKFNYGVVLTSVDGYNIEFKRRSDSTT